ncbi:MAG TPA: RHS repeat-associated core domain-containing protein [Candidatus Saccharimonadales bacterium]|jgi:RHS repeat-associated protein|nr:RHS repeat-associated core domain-containing protein [Candidatus Saccharimonadales bacterium]
MVQRIQPTPEGNILADTAYDPVGQAATVTNPYLLTSDPTFGITQMKYDAVGRPVRAIKQDGSVSIMDHSQGNCTISTDESGKQRRNCGDGLGRLVEVDEPNPGATPTAAAGWINISGGEQTTSATVTIPVANSGFELPAVGAGNFQYGPSGGSWTFSGQVGVSANGSGFTSGNPAAPEGSQVAFIQNGAASVISQSLSGFQAGVSYAVSFYAAQRGTSNSGGEDFDVYLDNILLATFTPGAGSQSNNVYILLSTPAFTTTSGTHTLKFVGRDSLGGDNTAFIDAVQVLGTGSVPDTGTVTVSVNGAPYTYPYGANDTAATVSQGLVNAINAGSVAKATAMTDTDVAVSNSGFETPVQAAGGYQYGPTGGSWTFQGGTGVAANGSAFTSGNPPAPSGTQVAFIQNANGSLMYQLLSGFQAGISYTVTFYAAQRGNYNQGGQDFDVYLDDRFLGNFNPPDTTYRPFSTPPFTATGAHVLMFVGRDSVTGENTAFVDQVRVAAAAGNLITITSAATGSPANYTLTTSSTHSSNVTQSSFAATASGPNLTGGYDPGNVNNNPYVTQYSYDALGDLLSVNQIGDGTAPRVRNFTYDSLGRLLTAINPESGKISYVYDNAGNLLQKTSPAPNQPGAATQTISYCYDALHRVTGRAYSAQLCQNGQLPAGTAVVGYVYDQGTNGIGRLTGLTDQAGTASYSYDIMGRMATETRTIAGKTKTVSYDYNLDGSLKALHYPSGAVVTYTPDSAGRIVSAVDTANAINYVTQALYGPHSALSAFVSGNSSSFAGITNSFSYNSRLQPVIMSAASPSQTVLSLGYDFHLGNGNNGNVYGIANYKDTTRNQAFTYDALNRLATARNAGTDCSQMVLEGNKKFWGNTYVYDPWGNLLQKASLMDSNNPTCAGEGLSVTVGNNNRISTAGYAYDAAGNMTNDTRNAYTYDQENRITGAGGFNYTYDADGNRVEKANGSTGTLYWYLTPGVIGESDLTGTMKSEYVFFNGERVARRDLVMPTGVFFYFSDHLKTTDIVTDAQGNILNESDFYPWGGELKFVANDANHYKFTGKERDSETGLDYFGARYYSNVLGRFITSDWSAVPVPVPYADLSDPQSLNQYTYVRSLPTTRIDADGHCFWDVCAVETLVYVGAAAATTAFLASPVGQQAVKAGGWILNKTAEAGGEALNALGNGCAGAGNLPYRYYPPRRPEQSTRELSRQAKCSKPQRFKRCSGSPRKSGRACRQSQG